MLDQYHVNICNSNIYFINVIAYLIAFTLENKYSINCLMTNMLVTCSNCYALFFSILDLPRDCSDVRSGNGVYQMYPNTSEPNCFTVYCEIGSDGNTWTV